MDQERMVYERYQRASQQKEEALCCPTTYNAKYLHIIPEEIIERDYGCGDPSRYVLEGETVLDLGSGAGKLVYIIAQVVGQRGRVIGVDMNKDMLSLARKYEDTVAERLGYKNFVFKRGRIQNLRLDLEKLDNILQEKPISNLEDYIDLEFKIKELEKDFPLVANESIDVVVSNCVLNLVRDEEKKELFKELFRVLKRDGRAVISDIVSDKDVPSSMKEDPELWSGCISGAMKENDFIDAFKIAGFKEVEIIKKDDKPWRVIDGINFYSLTVSAYKGEKKINYNACCGFEQIIVSFNERLKTLGESLVREKIDYVQINVGGLCNQSCNHCHHSAGPDDNRVMSKDVIDKIIDLARTSDINVYDITGGAPELNPYIDYLIGSLKDLKKRIIFRTNLTALYDRRDIISLFKDGDISIYASLPSLNEKDLEKQRGFGVFDKSIEILRELNSLGFGVNRELNIVYNPTNFDLPADNLLEIYKNTLKNKYGVLFNNIIPLTNVPIGNFKNLLESEGFYDSYMRTLMGNFNSQNLKSLMCRTLISIGYDGSIYDCDFNNALGIKVGNISDLRGFEDLVGKAIKIADHCYACCAKKGSSCFGSLCK